MTAFVIDASVAPAWLFEDEASEEGWQILERLRIGHAFAPTIWPTEIANILVRAERRKRVTFERTNEFRAMLLSLDIRFDEHAAERGLGEILNLARAAMLTAHDAAYLDLALRLGIGLATRDHRLASAAERMGVVAIRF